MHVKVAIIGLDAVSTSMGLALKRYQKQPGAQHTFEIMGSDSTAHAMKSAQKIGAVDNFHRQVLKAADNADLIIVNKPYSELEELYERLGPQLKPGAVVLDMAQIKEPSIWWAKQHFPHNDDGSPIAYLVGITPIINVEALYSGALEAEHAREDLFDRGEVLITPDAKCPSEAIQLAEDIARLVGGKTRFMDPQEHDGLLAATEGLPALVGISLFYSLSQSEGWAELRRMINPTLALATLALRTQKPQDGLALFSRNRDNLVRHLESLIGTLDQVRDLLAENYDQDTLDVFLRRAQDEWDKWDVKRHSGEWDERSQVDTLPGPLGSMSGFFALNRRKKDNGDEE